MTFLPLIIEYRMLFSESGSVKYDCDLLAFQVIISNLADKLRLRRAFRIVLLT